MDNNEIVYIYSLINTKERIAYIGQTKDIERRKKEHFDKPIKQIKSDIEKYGIKAFEFKVIDECFYRHRYIVEAWWTRKYGENYVLYNIKPGNNHSIKTKKRLSIVTSGKNNGMYGKKKDNKVLNGQNVWMYDKDSNLIKEFNSVKMALRFCGVKSHTQLLDACRNGTEYKGFYWKKTFKNI